MNKIKVTAALKSRDITLNGVNLTVHADGTVLRDGCKIGRINKDGYLCAYVGNRPFKLHRIVYYAFNPDFDIWNDKMLIDHDDRIRKNNNIYNLRICNKSQNNMNTNTRCDNALGCKNITRLNDKRWGWFWLIQVYSYGKKFTKMFKGGDGRYQDDPNSNIVPQHVIDHRNHMLKEHHGEFANFS